MHTCKPAPNNLQQASIQQYNLHPVCLFDVSRDWAYDCKPTSRVLVLSSLATAFLVRGSPACSAPAAHTPAAPALPASRPLSLQPECTLLPTTHKRCTSPTHTQIVTLLIYFAYTWFAWRELGRRSYVHYRTNNVMLRLQVRLVLGFSGCCGVGGPLLVCIQPHQQHHAAPAGGVGVGWLSRFSGTLH